MKQTPIDGELTFTCDPNYRRTALLKRLKDLATVGDAESAHLEADKQLLEYINDKEISKAFNAIERWYS